MPATDFARIPEGHSANLDTIIRAANDGNLGLISAKDATTGADKVVLAAFHIDDEGMVVVTPFGALSDDPYAEFIPVTSEDE
jgi:hypothetical protein